MNTRKIFYALAMLLAAGCPCPCPAGPMCPVEVVGDADPNVAPSGIGQNEYGALDTAGQACAVLASLKCPEATATCAADTRKLVTLGTFQQSDVTCVRASRTVAKVRTCNVECKYP